MKQSSLTLACVLSGLLAGTQIAAAFASDNPYVGSITNRNPFGLKPPPDPASLVPVVQAPPLPNVLLAGITTLFGNPKACLRVPRPAKPPEPAKEVSLFLSPGGAAEEGVRVLEINVAAGTVKIENNGTVQDLDMTKNAPKSTGAPPPAPSALPVPPPRPGGIVPAPPSMPPVPAVTSFSRPLRGSNSSNSGGDAAGRDAVASTGLSGGWSGPGLGGAGQAPIDREEQQVLIEAQRMANVEHAIVLPPTDLGKQLESENGSGGGSVPVPQ